MYLRLLILHAHGLYIMVRNHLKIFRFKEWCILRIYIADKIVGTVSCTGLTSPVKSPGIEILLIEFLLVLKCNRHLKCHFSCWLIFLKF